MFGLMFWKDPQLLCAEGLLLGQVAAGGPGGRL